MQVFCGILLQYFAILTNKKSLNFELLNMLVKPLIEMSMEIPYFAAICARQRLLKTRSQFCEAIKTPDRASILSSVVETLRGFVEINGGLSNFSEIFLPISTLLHQVGNQEKTPQTLKEKLEDVAALIETKTDELHTQRKPLAMRKQKPVAIRMVNPKFEENFVKGRDYDPDKLRSEYKKLKKKLKQEAKGAVRELRKDSYVMSEVKSKEKALHEQERAEKHGKAWAFLQEQEHAFKSGQLGKGKGKKRRR